MITDTDSDIIWSNFSKYVVVLISFVVLLFDHCLTFSSEIEHIWNKRKTPFSCLFLLNRYFALLAVSVYICIYILPQGCRTGVKNMDGYNIGPQSHSAAPLIFALSVFTMLTAEAMIALRVYAVYQKSKYILLVLSLVWISHFALLIWIYCTPIIVEDKQTSDFIATVEMEGPGLSVSLTTGTIFVAPALGFDIIAGVLLMLRLYQQSSPHMPLMTLVVRDGLFYFAVIFISNVVWVVGHIYNRTVSPIPLFHFTPMEIWSACITTTMISRLTLNLKMYDSATNDELTFQSMSIRFQHMHHLTSLGD
ncbi:hypothetical protein BDZ94DRAFT_1294761 [Collybia nuda]|uniref:DUF6533 domain-containing protein n=1 Tax=Collybia nuda TaxID=64659 RepID=A0A9P6CPC6_9AGAR|nr:hypothetical protein BDZ94DRAFT_1294761 [Collybia nuda]